MTHPLLGRTHPPDCGHCAALRGKPSGFAGKRHTESAKAAIGVAGIGRPSPKSAEQRAKLSAALTGRSLSASHKAAIGRAGKGRTKSPQHRARISEAKRGHAVSEETRDKLRAAALRQFQEKPGRWAGTQPEQLMAALLEWGGVPFEGQKRIGRYFVDFYLPGSGSVIEVDGAYWHPDGPDAKRDTYLMAHGVRHITHITDTQLALAGWSVL